MPIACANRFTRSSSIIQRTSRTSSQSAAPRGSSVSQVAYSCSTSWMTVHLGPVAGRVVRQPLQPPLDRAQVAAEVEEAVGAGRGHEARVDQAGQLTLDVGDRRDDRPGSRSCPAAARSCARWPSAVRTREMISHRGVDAARRGPGRAAARTPRRPRPDRRVRRPARPPRRPCSRRSARRRCGSGCASASAWRRWTAAPEISAIGDGIDSSSRRRVPATIARFAARAESKTRTATLSPSSTSAG